MNNVDDRRPPPAATLADTLRHWARVRPEGTAYTFLLDGERDELHLTYGQLDRKAAAIALALAEVAAPGDRALLVYPPGLEFVAAFFGCLYAGVVAVPVFPPGPARPLGALERVALDAGAKAALIDAPSEALAGPLLASSEALGRVPRVVTDLLPAGAAGAALRPPPDPGALAFLQYTSGSTREPKGVRVTHRNLMAQQAFIKRAFRHDERTVVVGWLPVYHDMGLIGNVMQPLYLGTRCVLMSPFDFLSSPLRWLRAIARYRATTSGGPNFGYELCVRKFRPEAAAGLDLQSWEVAYNGAEPLRPATIARFAETYAPYGFRRESFLACYGLAEATLAVSTGGAPVAHFDREGLERRRAVPAPPGSPSARALVGSGDTLLGRVEVVDPERRVRCEPGQVGEVWLESECVADGYWRRAEGDPSFGARLSDDAADGPFLRTGDLAFLRGGELFIVGRIKDTLVLRGRNHYAHDLEAAAEASHPGLRPGCAAAFAVERDGEERAVVVQELAAAASTQAAAAAEAIRLAVARESGVALDAVVLVAPRTVAKTSSGKIRRQECKRAYLAGELEVVAEYAFGAAGDGAAGDGAAGDGAAGEGARAAGEGAPATDVERAIADIWREVLGVPEVDVGRSLFELGGDSIKAAQVINRVDEAFQIRVRPASVGVDFTVRSLALAVDELLVERLEGLSEDEARALLDGEPER
jgi:acyl-CoA synthetase (AMP-forming)/AMP-acid ligase II/acyl carrier protein